MDKERLQLTKEALIQEHQQAEAALNQHVQQEMMHLANLAGRIAMLDSILKMDEEGVSNEVQA